MFRRRNFMTNTAVGLTTAGWLGLALAQPKKASQILWGGLGYSAANADVPYRFPHVQKAAEQIGWSNLVSAFTGALKKTIQRASPKTPPNCWIPRATLACSSPSRSIMSR